MDESAIDALCKRLRKHGASGFLIGDEARDALLDIRAKLAAAERERERLRAAIIKCRAHAGHLSSADSDLLAGLLYRVARICDAALAAGGRGEEG